MEKTPEKDFNEESIDSKLVKGYQMRKKAERIDNEIEKIINEKISRISENLVKEKEVLKMGFLELVKEVAKSYPKVECRASCEFDNLLEDRAYYIIGLPKDISFKEIYINSTPRDIELIIDGEKYKGDRDFAKDEEDLFLRLIDLLKDVDIDGISDLGILDLKDDIEEETKSELLDDLSLDSGMIEKALDLFLANKKTDIIEVEKSDKELIKALYFIKNVSKYCDGIDEVGGGIASISINSHLISSELLRKYDTNVYHISKYYADYEIKIV